MASQVNERTAESLDSLARNRLQGKVAIVTGSGQGIGRATVRRFGAEGARIIVADRDRDSAVDAVTELKDHSVEAIPIVCDLSSYKVAENLVGESIDAFGQVDILVNNVGGATSLRPYWEWEHEEIVEEVGRSIWPTAWCSRAVLPHMIQRGQGSIVNVGAESVRNGLWERAPYNMGKGAVHALTTSIAREVAEFGITCNCVAPGPTGSSEARLKRRRAAELSSEEAAHVNELAERTRALIPMARIATEEEQAAAIVFLASDDATFITGQVLSVNGGSSML